MRNPTQPPSAITYSFLSRPTPDQINRIISLYRGAGWWTDSNDDTELTTRIVTGSHCFIIALAHDKLIGMGRALSDGVSDAYIQDVAVADAYQKQGIGKQIVALLVERLQKDGLTWIGLIAERNSQMFYERLGFKKMPDAAPMLMIKP